MLTNDGIVFALGKTLSRLLDFPGEQRLHSGIKKKTKKEKEQKKCVDKSVWVW